MISHPDIQQMESLLAIIPICYPVLEKTIEFHMKYELV